MWRRPALFIVLALVVLAGAIGWRIQSDEDLQDEAPLVSDTEPDTPPSLDELRAAAEASPNDALAWQQLAFSYFSQNMFAEAAEAYERATDAEPQTAVLWSSLGEARVMASQDEPLPEHALNAFRRAIELDASDPRARYFLAVEKDLAEDHEGAITDWLALLADTPPGAPWETDLVRTIQQVGQLHGIATEERIARASATRDILPSSAISGIPGPTQEQMAAAATLSPVEQQDMAEAMVERLASRLESDPGDVEGWIMLMRSYATLGRRADAQDAYRRAVNANPQASETLLQAAETFGL